MAPGDVLVVVTFAVVGLAVTLLVASRSRAVGPVIVTFVAHLLIGWFVWETLGFYSDDAGGYDFIARAYVAYWNGSVSHAPDFSTSKEGWVLILATIYRFLGSIPLLGIIFNAVASAVTTSLVMGTTTRLGWESKARAAGWLMLLPAFLLWSSLLLREAMAWMLAAMALWAAAGLVRRANTGAAVWLLAAIAASLWIRGSLAAVMLVGAVAGIVAARRRIPAPLMLIGAALAVVGGPLLSRFVSITGGADIEQINAARASLSTAGSGFATSAYSSPADIVTSLPSTLPRTLVGPYPQEFSGLPQSALVDWAFWILLLYLAWRGWRWAPGRGRWLIAAPTLAVLISIAATSGNYGTMVRLRATPAVMLVPLAAAGLQRKPKRRPRDTRATPAAPIAVPVVRSCDPSQRRFRQSL